MPSNKRTNSKESLSGPEQVAEFMNNLEHPLKEEITEVRKIILGTNSKITEKIKWNAPSYCVDDHDRITFNLNGKGFFRLIFHCGAKVKEIPNNEPLFVDSSEILEWVTGDRAIVKFSNMDDVKAKENDLREVVEKWIRATT
ncbi:MAG TPA: DUF1801 domain-containing protein [Bacillus bacterium]|uniref:DUF1801 domain-containing protein n=1 Tax=Siminovitchia fordii TaxID=254759 RepID=UPI00037E1749|nr:DUF1801 domain-containing protein [Siminovitchia fordii]HBZ09101.1 DUF1801 domain-containing protein [Bacillus sp. (in: firmicutes)]